MCGYPGLPANALVHPSDQTEFLAGSVVTYSCLPGFVMFGPASLECGEGWWSSDNPVCRENIALGQQAQQSHTLWDFKPGENNKEDRLGLSCAKLRSVNQFS